MCMYLYEFYVHYMHVGFHRNQERALEPLDLGLQSWHVGSGYQILSKSSKGS